MLIAQYMRNAIFGKVFRKSNSAYTEYTWRKSPLILSIQRVSRQPKNFLTQDAHSEEKNQSVQNTIFCPY